MGKDNKKLKFGILLLVVTLAFLLRTAWLQDNLFFGWEQGRDLLKLKEIASSDLTLVGPKTDIDGVFHGALSYYIPLPFYLVFRGDPRLMLYSFILINSVAIGFLYKTLEEMFNKKVAIVSSLVYAFSYSSIVYARWLSNPNLVPAFTILFFYFLWKAKSNWKYLILACISWYVIFHLIVIVAISLIAPSLVFLLKEKIKITIPRILIFLAISAIMLSPYFAFEIKNNFLMTKSFFGDSRSHGNFIVSSLGLIDQFINEVVDSITPLYPRISFIIFFAVFFYAIQKSGKKENLYILSFLLSVPFLFLFVSDAPLRHFFITAPIFLAILIGIVFEELLKEKKEFKAYFLVSIVVFGNLLAIHKRLPESEANFIHHAQRTYISDMINLIDYAYKDADGKEFTYDYYSMPYWKEDAWIYLFQWYGKGKYGYAPQVDRTNVDRSEVFYTFIEPNETAPIHQNNWYGEYKKNLELLDTYESGKLKVEKRKEKSNLVKS